MSDNFRPSGREVLIDVAVTQSLEGESYKNHQFDRLVAIKKRFKDCDFSYSHFSSSYMRNCVFDSCTFIGCKFTQSNLRGSKFIGCTFDYAEFSQTLLDPEILESGCPSRENLQQRFARALRVNFHQIGDTVAANNAIKIELEATRVHLYKSWRSRESYYRQKYQGFSRFRAFVDWLKFVILDAYWGNGESPAKLLRSLAVLLMAIAVGDVIFLRDPSVLTSYQAALGNAPQVLIGIDRPPNFPGISLTVIAFLRYIFLACLVSILVKRFSRR